MSPGPRYSFGPFVLLPTSGELWKSGLLLKLAPQPFQLLTLLIERAGKLVTREDLQSALWADGTVVEFDQGLNYCIRQIRLVLGDDAREPTYIETVPKRGYRFIAPVTVLNAEEPAAAPVVPEPTSRWRSWLLLGTAAALVVAGFLLWPQGTLLPSDPKARQLFLEAEHLTGTWEMPKVQDAVALYAEVTRIEPDFAPAWAGWTNADIVLGSLADSELHARKALSLDSTLSTAHAALGHSYWQQWKWDEADKEFQLALDGDGDTATAHQLYGLYLASVGRRQEAVMHARRAVETQPVSGLFNYSLAQVYLQTGDYQAALAQAERTLRIDRHYPNAFQNLLRANIQLGRLAEAERALDEEMLHFQDKSLTPWRVFLLARSGRVQQARALFQAEAFTGRKNPHPSLGHAAALLAIEGADAALDALDDAVSAHVGSMQWIWTAPELTPLHAVPRFREIAGKTGKVLVQ